MLEKAAKDFVLRKPTPHSPNFVGQVSNNALVRPLLGKLFTKQLRKQKVNPLHYPAPYAVVDNWVKYGTSQEAMINEARSIAKLMITPTARNLVRIFFLQEQLKKFGKGAATPKHIHVIGAGTMGGDIAAWCAYKNFQVTLQDQSPEKIAPAIKRAYKLFEKKCREPRLIQAAMDRLTPDHLGKGVASADIIIEAVFENLKVKQDIFKKVESECKADAILATNTSSIPLEEIETAMQDPTRLVGIHFFNPVAKMPLVEIVQGKHTNDKVMATACAFVGKISKLPLPVSSKPGFLVNRVLMPYLMEATYLYEEGVSAGAIDKAAVAFGMPMGPITLADTVGLDVCLHVAENLTAHFGGKVPDRLKTLVSEGRLGVKTGRGFYAYQNGKPVKLAEKNDQVPEDLTDRLIMRMLNESVACLSEQVVANPDLLDAGMIFGTGFAPYLGGPMEYAKTRGIKHVIETLETLAAKHGERFKPHAYWKTLE